MSSNENNGTTHDSVLKHLGGLSLADTTDQSTHEPLTCAVADPLYDSECDDEGDDESDDEVDDESDSNHDDTSTMTTTPFNPRRCLFCRSYSNDLSATLLHMEHKHGFRPPPETDLVVDLETLVKYLHLVVFDFCECLLCGRSRDGVEAIQQHMTGKSHCKIDWKQENSEYKEFCCTEDEDAAGNNRPNATTTDDHESWTLPSGSVVSHRSRKTRSTRSTEVSHTGKYQSSAIELSTETSTDQAISKRMVKREAVFQSQLATLRPSDRSALMHLPTAMQRVILLRSKRMVEKGQRDKNQMLLRIQLNANKILKR